MTKIDKMEAQLETLIELANKGRGGFASSGVVTSGGTNNPLYYALAFIQKT